MGGTVSRDQDVRRYRVTAEFSELEAFLKDAIAEQGIKISNISHIGNMLARTGQDIGSAKPVYRHGKAIEFCSAKLSRLMLESNPHDIIFCPYIIYIYELSTEPNQVYLAYRRLRYNTGNAANPVFAQIEALLDEIIANVSE